MDIVDRVFIKHSGTSSLQNGLTLQQFRDSVYEILEQFTPYYVETIRLDSKMYEDKKSAIDNWLLSYTGTGLGMLHHGNNEFMTMLRNNYESLEAIIAEDKYKVLRLLPDVDAYLYNKFYKNNELIDKAYELISDVIIMSKERLINFFQTDKLGMTPLYGHKITSKLFPNSCMSFSNGMGYLIFEDTLC